MIKNIVFDIGNVLLKWEPLSVVEILFSEYPDHAHLTHQMFKSETWIALNRGEISEQQVIERYHKTLKLDLDRLTLLMGHIKKAMLPVEGSLDLLDKLYQKNIPLFALTDNTKEIFGYLQNNYDFWPKFQGIVVSAELGCVKPSPEIYRHLLNSYNINANETVFIDDLAYNVEGAKAVGMYGIQFMNAKQCASELQDLEVYF